MYAQIWVKNTFNILFYSICGWSVYTHSRLNALKFVIDFYNKDKKYLL
jgi:hypothetical protein